eukprot:TRINITY_DN46379_c0_g1_i1.p1 TRINITY_DN46379_c0_g1~~TRINITY_DN46379_c0_g1_i1.p1  ORF type:complete len:401 (+),score=72.42 TRINITY_DN46379_c0_g1_i1:37-1203(+)
MPNVLWGVACMTLDGQCTPGDVVSKFRQAMKLDEWPTEGDDCKQDVDLYRLVPITAESSCWLADQEQLLVHLPGAAISCEAIEDLYRQIEEAEIRCERSRESVMALVDALHSREGSAGFSTSRLLAPEVHEDLIEGLRHEIASLRQKLDISEYSRRAAEERGQITQECQAALMREFSMLVQEVTSRPAALARPPAASPSAAKPAVPAAPAASTRDLPAASSALSGAGSSPALSLVPQTQSSGVQPAQAAPVTVTASSPGVGQMGGQQCGMVRVPQLRLPSRAVQGQPCAGQYASGASYAPPPQARLAFGGGCATGPLTDRSSDRSSRSEAWGWSSPVEGAAHASAGSLGLPGASAATAAVAPIASGGRASPANAKVKITPLRLNGLRA